MAFKTQYNAKPSKPEVLGGVSKTEKAGYLPSKQMIEGMIMAGLRLKAFRADNYDLAEGEEDDGESIDPTRSPGFDLADASQIQMELKRKKKAAEKAAKDIQDAAKSDPEASGEEAKPIVVT